MQDFRLNVFYAVASHLSFTKAANELFITQPAVTKNIKELETEYAIRLFERKGNKIILTTAVKILLTYTEQIRELYQRASFDLNLLNDKYSGQIKLGASTTIGQYILPPLLAKFYQSFPEIHISLLNDNTENIEAALEEHKITLGIVEGKTHHKQLKYIPFIEDEIVAVVHNKSKLAGKESVDLKKLTTIPIVLRERGSGTLEVIEDALGKKDIKLNQLTIAMYLGSTESIKLFLSNIDCIGFVSVAAVAKEITNGEFKIINIKDLNIKRSFYFVHLQGKTDGLTEKFMRYIVHHYNQK